MRRLTFTNANGVAVVFGPPPASYVIESLDGIGTPGFSKQVQRGPGQDGESYIDGTLDPREITVSGALVKQLLPDIYPLRASLNSALNPKLGPGNLLFEYDGGSKKIAAIPDGAPLFSEKGSDLWQKYQVAFYCPDPLWQDVTGIQTTVGLVQALFKFPWRSPQGVGFAGSERLSDKARTVTLAGDVSAPIIATFWGPATNPTILNQTTGEFIHILATLGDGESMVINTAYGNKSVTLNRGSLSSNGLQYLDINSTFWQLQPGANVITFYDDTGSLAPRCDIAASPRYLGV